MANSVTSESSPGSQASTQNDQSQRDSGVIATQTLQEPIDWDSNGTTWKKLDYRPSVLKTWVLLLAFIFNCAVIAGLVTFHFKRVISVNTATYYGLNALLIIVAILYEDYTEPGLFVNLWAYYTLLAFYSIIQTYLLILILYFWKTPTTGLRWDPVSIADILSLFRHSDFLNKFKGSSIAKRQSMNSELGDLRIRLGYWRMSEGTHWHGFALIGI
ncbi:hypothetical protein CGCSCA4_v006871 [Colletotrichum siamense]|uniref:Uncharacterized protein n=1 Tax=Colletotrichum siamense TaxID=690259 RepID=A0A9P5K6G9_COLSI|nr:uncharacterized protein CGCS363_v014271 [Colletotrichum siamense]KAF4845405.1 hypothetical protein CGCSCA4_v006871 [Colletotrichum siamense]KAF4860914.1 hypothetical protein CGCSCA2_v005159 [Colletotrichum siamense]KAF5484929.1 hypothetical protein CGCS363_v014271 [Colletotrichum siamense]